MQNGGFGLMAEPILCWMPDQVRHDNWVSALG
jgi:hypothetical protein